jgi:RNA polymerase sigma-70 factor, ECF subfamily
MDEGRSAVRLSDLVRDHYALVYRYAFRLSGSAEEAEDLTQQAFLTAHRRLGQLREARCAKAWLCAIVRNTFLSQVTTKRAARTISLQETAEPVEAAAKDIWLDPSELQQVLNELTEEYRTPLILFYFEEFSYREIAEEMDVPIGTVMSRLARGKSYLRRRLEAFQATAAR